VVFDPLFVGLTQQGGGVHCWDNVSL